MNDWDCPTTKVFLFAYKTRDDLKSPAEKQQGSIGFVFVDEEGLVQARYQERYSGWVIED